MDASLLKAKFQRIGARAAVRPLVHNRWRPAAGPVVIDVGHDGHGEFFDVQAAEDANVDILDVQPKDRHLLLMVRQPAERPNLPETKVGGAGRQCSGIAWSLCGAKFRIPTTPPYGSTFGTGSK